MVGLTWLKNGESSVGSNPASDVVLPKSAPDRVGTLTLAKGKVIFKPAAGLAPGAVMTSQPGQTRGQSALVQPAREMELHPDVDANYTRVVVGRVKFFVIQRGENNGGSQISSASGSRTTTAPRAASSRACAGIPSDPSWRVTAQYVPFDKPRQLHFETEVGVTEHDPSPGYVQF